MDKSLVGKWYKEEMGETLNIFDEVPLRVKLSFTSSGYYNFEPNCVYEKDGYLCFELNDEKNRMVYHVKRDGDGLKGYYTQFGKEVEICYKRLSDKPEDAPYRYVPVQINVPQTGEKRIDLLRQYGTYDRSRGESYDTAYVLGGELPPILEKYGFSRYFKEIDLKGDGAVFRMLDFVCDHFGHNGTGGLGAGRKIEDIIDFCEKHDGKTNCRGLSILLASLLRLISVKARHITCMPYEDPFDDCHVVVDCLLPSGERVMLDPTWRLFLKDSEGGYVSIERLREILSAREPFYANEGAAYNGKPFDAEYYRDYMVKNTIRFSRGIFYENGSEEEDSASRRVELVPAKYPVGRFGDSEREKFVYDDIAFWRM